MAPLSPSPAPALRAEVLLTGRLGGPAVHKRMTGAYLHDLCGGSGFLSKAANHLGFRGHALETKFGPRYGVTKPLVRTRIRQDVSAGKCVAE